jgi:hypothetical protein
MFLISPQIFALHVTKSLNDVLSSEHIREICRYIYNIQACLFFLMIYLNKTFNITNISNNEKIAIE